MRVPGSNILNKALRVIGKQQLTYFRFTGNVTQVNGVKVPSFAPGVVIEGSFQPVDRAKYVYMNLDLQKEYWKLYAPQSFLDLQRDVAGDQLERNGARFQVESAVPWDSVDGWAEALCVKIAPRGPVINV